MVMPPYHGATIRVPESAIYDFFRALSDAIDIPIMIQDAPVERHAAVGRLPRAHGAARSSMCRYFKIEYRGAAAKLRELIELGGDAIEGPWDGEEAITLLAGPRRRRHRLDDRRRLSRTASGRSSTPTMQAGATKLRRLTSAGCR